MEATRVHADILAGYLTLLNKSNYVAAERNGIGVIEMGVEKTENRGMVLFDSSLAVLKNSVSAMKEHIKKAEQFIKECAAADKEENITK